jgi:hypothetical protein
MYQVVADAVHVILLIWWLYIQSIKSESVYVVGAIPTCGASCVQV